MPQDITNIALLEHMQGIRYSLEQKIDKLERKVEQGFQDVDKKFFNVDKKVQSIHKELQEAKQHRQALQEDLEATILMQGKHQQTLDRISL